MNYDSETVHLPKAWTKTDWSGGDECQGEAISECGDWRLVRRRDHWFVERRTLRDGGCDWNPYRRRLVFQWERMGGSPTFRLLTDAKKYLTIEGMIQNGRERGLL